MYLIAIAWIYVAILAAVSDTSVVGGVITFLFYGVGPLALFMWIFGSPSRRRRRAAAEAADTRPTEAEAPEAKDGEDA